MSRNRFQTNNLNELNERRRIQENGGRREIFGNNREDRRNSGNYEPLEGENIRGERSRGLFIDDAILPEMISNIDMNIDWSSHFSSYFSTNTKRRVKENIKPYNYTPNEFIFSKLESDIDNPLFLGAEIEVDKGGEDDDNAKYVIDNLENCYVVHDGSLRDGFEIVTHPATLNYHKQMNYKEVFKELVNKGYKAHDTVTCGLHIHFNRDYLSSNKTIQDLCITKILFLLERYCDNIEKLARRQSNKYSNNIKRNKEDDSLLDLLYKAKGSGMFNSAKYNAVNLMHEKAVELRMFKGTLKYETYMATLEFVKNLVDISKQIPLDDIQSVTFEEIIDINPTEYLIEYLRKRGVINEI